MSKRMRGLNRREFLKLSPIALSSAFLACSKGERRAAETAVLSPSAPLTLAPGTFAETIFMNGKVVTLDAGDTVVQAVGITDGLISKTGSDKAIRSLIGPKTQVMDLRGRTLTPGLIGAHIHPQQMGLYSRMISFLPPEVKSIQDMKRKLADVVGKTAKGDWIRGISLFQAMPEGRMPNRQDLDAVSPAHPVWIMHQGGHLGVANSLALKIANISAHTPNPTGGIIERDSKGYPPGVLYNLTHLEISRQGKMLLRGAIYYALERPHDLDDALRIERYGDKFIRFAGFKFIMDCQMTIAYCHEPHKGVMWNMPI